MIYNVLNLIVLFSISWSFFVDHNKLDTIDMIALIFIVLFWLVPRVMLKPHQCVACQLKETKPQRSNFAETTSFLNARNLWRRKKDFLNKMSQDFLQDVSKDLYIVHAGVTIKQVGFVEFYLLQTAQNLEDSSGEGHQVSTLEAYLQYFEGEIESCDE